jgi:hypothetical protein
MRNYILISLILLFIIPGPSLAQVDRIRYFPSIVSSGSITSADSLISYSGLRVDGSSYLGGNAGTSNKILSVYRRSTLGGSASQVGAAIYSLALGGTSGSNTGITMTANIADADGSNYTNLYGLKNQCYAGLDALSGAGSTATAWTGTATNIYGSFNLVSNYSTSTGKISNAYANYNEVGVASAGIIRNAYGLYVNKVHATGTDAGQTHNAYALYIANNITASGGATNNAYSIYSASTANSYLAGPLGIGLSPSYPLHVANATVSGYSFNQLGFIYNKTEVVSGHTDALDVVLEVNNQTTTSKAYRAVKGSCMSSTTALGDYTNTVALRGLFFETIHQAPGTCTGMAGCLAASGASGTSVGTITNNYGFFSRIYNLSIGTTTTNSYGFYAENSGTSGTLTNFYGYYLPTLSAGITNKWGIYIADSGANNYLAGSLGIGTTVPGAVLTVNSKSDTLLQTFGDRDGKLWSSADSSGLMVLQNGNVEIGTNVNQRVPALTLRGDADSDVGQKTNESLGLSLATNGNPIYSKWAFTSTQGLGYSFDKNLHIATGYGVGLDASNNAVSRFIFSDTGLSGGLINIYTSNTIGAVNSFAGLYFSPASGIITGKASGTVDLSMINMPYTINLDAGITSGTVTGIFTNATETNLRGKTHNLMDLQVGSTSKFKVGNNGDVTIGGGQISGQVEYDCLTMGFDSPSTMSSDSLFPTCNKYPYTITVDSIRGISNVDDQDLSLYYKKQTGGGTTLIDALVCATNQTNQYTVLETTISQASIPANALIGIKKPSVAGVDVKVFIYYHYTRVKR